MTQFHPDALYVVRNLPESAGSKNPVWAIAVYPRHDGAFELQWSKSLKTPVIHTKDLALALGMFAVGGSVRFADVAAQSAPANLFTPGKMKEIVVNGVDIRREISGEREFESEPPQEKLLEIGKNLLARCEVLRTEGRNLRTANAVQRMNEMNA